MRLRHSRSPSLGSTPSTETVPPVRSRKPSRISTVVVLPAPFGPRKAKDLSAGDAKVDAGDRFRRSVAHAEFVDDDDALLGRGIREALVLGQRHEALGCVDEAHSVVPRAGSGVASEERSYNRRRGLGAHQFHLPRSSIREGTSRPRITNASISTASAMPSPSSLMKTRFEVTKAPIATENRSAAAVTIRPVRSNPIATARLSGTPLSCASLIREIRKTP